MAEYKFYRIDDDDKTPLTFHQYRSDSFTAPKGMNETTSYDIDYIIGYHALDGSMQMGLFVKNTNKEVAELIVNKIFGTLASADHTIHIDEYRAENEVMGGSDHIGYRIWFTVGNIEELRDLIEVNPELADDFLQHFPRYARRIGESHFPAPKSYEQIDRGFLSGNPRDSQFEESPIINVRHESNPDRKEEKLLLTFNYDKNNGQMVGDCPTALIVALDRMGLENVSIRRDPKYTNVMVVSNIADTGHVELATLKNLERAMYLLTTIPNSTAPAGRSNVQCFNLVSENIFRTIESNRAR